MLFMAFLSRIDRMVFVLLGVAAAGFVSVADAKDAKPYEIVKVTCALDGRDTNATGMGLTTCRYVCDGTDKAKVSRVYLSSTAVCPKVVQEQVKQLVR
jgi:uncharacterized OsmC-like protein